MLYAGRASSIHSYNILDEQYPTNVSADDALRRGLREISQDIKLRWNLWGLILRGDESFPVVAMVR